MATDLIKRAAAICGYPFTPNSDQLAAWLTLNRIFVTIDSSKDSGSEAPVEWWVEAQKRGVLIAISRAHASLLEALAAAVVEVDRIEREAAK